ncbi:glutaredoxin [Candidatus Woesearchaeota archaeon CG10_big_fil_rev_8_21_14_0_10_33_12]|nr:MAG: glutaredoxin [Candidatus Woesearchaeota archaeon CG10_big_fil_rev_8_21_14_0_10_33_12]
MNIKVLVTPQCSGCKIVKKYLDEMQITYDIIDITQSPEVLQKYPTMTAPTIVINEKVVFIGTPGKNELEKAIKHAERGTKL